MNAVYIGAMLLIGVAILRILPTRAELRPAVVVSTSTPARRYRPPTIDDANGLQLLRSEPFTGENVIVPATVVLPHVEVSYPEAGPSQIILDFRAALEPVRLTLMAWHAEGREHCSRCHEVGHPLLPVG